jgi:hypothetical protein
MDSNRRLRRHVKLPATTSVSTLHLVSQNVQRPVALAAAVPVQVGNASEFGTHQRIVVMQLWQDDRTVGDRHASDGRRIQHLHRNHLSSRPWWPQRQPESSAISSWISPDGFISLEQQQQQQQQQQQINNTTLRMRILSQNITTKAIETRVSSRSIC